jgi:hypothetical protein
MGFTVPPNALVVIYGQTPGLLTLVANRDAHAGQIEIPIFPKRPFEACRDSRELTVRVDVG